VIEITAHDPDGSIESVILYNGSKVLGERTSSPFSFTLKELEAGAYTLHAVATDNSKSSASSETLEFMVNLPEERRATFSIFPNPNNGLFSINFTTLEETGNYIIRVVDLMGNTFYNQEIPTGENEKQFDLSHLKSGVYFLILSSSQIITAQKFIKN
jgi:hypothetical protein